MNFNKISVQDFFLNENPLTGRMLKVLILLLAIVLSWNGIRAMFTDHFYGDDFDIMNGARLVSSYFHSGNYEAAFERMIQQKASILPLIYSAGVYYLMGNSEILLRLPDLAGWIMMLYFAGLTTWKLTNNQWAAFFTVSLLGLTILETLFARPITHGSNSVFVSWFIYESSKSGFSYVYSKENPGPYSKQGWILFIGFLVLPNLIFVPFMFHLIEMIHVYKSSNENKIKNTLIFLKHTAPFIIGYLIYIFIFMGIPAIQSMYSNSETTGQLAHTLSRFSFDGYLGPRGYHEQWYMFNHYVFFAAVPLVFYAISLVFTARENTYIFLVVSLYFFIHHFILTHTYPYILSVAIWLLPWFALFLLRFFKNPIPRTIAFLVPVILYAVNAPPWAVRKYNPDFSLSWMDTTIKSELKRSEKAGYIIGLPGFDGGYYFNDENRINKSSSLGAVTGVLTETERGCLIPDAEKLNSIEILVAFVHKEDQLNLCETSVERTRVHDQVKQYTLFVRERID